MLSIPEPRQVTIASQKLLARTGPGLLDLAIAIAAGAAGAYVLVRKEAIGALPGIAIAVALVPPLATVGMANRRPRRARPAGLNPCSPGNEPSPGARMARGVRRHVRRVLGAN